MYENDYPIRDFCGGCKMMTDWLTQWGGSVQCGRCSGTNSTPGERRAVRERDVIQSADAYAASLKAVETAAGKLAFFKRQAETAQANMERAAARLSGPTQ